MSLSNKKHEKVLQWIIFQTIWWCGGLSYLIDDLEQVTPEPSNLPSAIMFIQGPFSSCTMRNVRGAKLHVGPHGGNILIGELAAAVDGQGCAKLKQFTDQLFFRQKVVYKSLECIIGCGIQ
jgi:hypothetical protein